jgi:hypothetical protein
MGVPSASDRVMRSRKFLAYLSRVSGSFVTYINTKIRYGISTNYERYEHVSDRIVEIQVRQIVSTRRLGRCVLKMGRPPPAYHYIITRALAWQMVTVDGRSVGIRRPVMDTQMIRSAWNI